MAEDGAIGFSYVVINILNMTRIIFVGRRQGRNSPRYFGFAQSSRFFPKCARQEHVQPGVAEPMRRISDRASGEENRWFSALLNRKVPGFLEQEETPAEVTTEFRR